MQSPVSWRSAGLRALLGGELPQLFALSGRGTYERPSLADSPPRLIRRQAGADEVGCGHERGPADAGAATGPSRFGQAADLVARGIREVDRNEAAQGLATIRAGIRLDPDSLPLANAYRMEVFKLRRVFLAQARQEAVLTPTFPPHLEHEPIAFFEELVGDFESRNFEAVVGGEKNFARDFPESPKLAQALYLSGRASIAAGDYDEGIATLRRMLENHPKDENIPFADLYIAQALYMKGHVPATEHKMPFEEVLPRYEEALKAFRRVADKHAGAYLGFVPSGSALSWVAQGLMLFSLVVLLQALFTPNPMTTMAEMTGNSRASMAVMRSVPSVSAAPVAVTRTMRAAAAPRALRSLTVWHPFAHRCGSRTGPGEDRCLCRPGDRRTPAGCRWA